MPVTFICPSCRTGYTLADDWAGKRARCHACQTVITVPVPAPEPRLEPAAPAPRESITNQHLKAAGWLAIADVVITVLQIVLVVILAIVSTMQGRPSPLGVIRLLLTADLLISTYVFAVLRSYLHSRFQFHLADTPLRMLIWIPIVQVVSSWLSMGNPLNELPLDWAIVQVVTGGGIFIAYGVGCVVVGIRLLRSDNTRLALKPFARALLINGLTYITIVLSPIGILAKLVAFTLLGRVFLRAAR